ncbi:1-deoxy-D-xylulose-5-phosphate reductoisomerase [Rhodospirillum rubrum]|uniref:1-deoxy-D-xylulose-5-phosphate reductoisomerase n=1 Tax=Rhodospirillum rubrum TaxID=1085 RepID=UPI001906F10E|nr:1-deoxy-D-xylulose-5-phosphate reductoisomerase [Rhodospirillum rubrum]MBK1663288.1 1-deoxy-D-xylulose-5-phosphate reductoisomerase [Rhodospirillum rubrum]MBK1675099.1 1-deoxy-D-xylulose-5-phosphate reductoisomerase [Rhodospirillum rubrum]
MSDTANGTPRRVSILGSTGSIGKNTLDLIGRSPERYQVVALTANGNAEALAAQAKATRAEIAVVADEAAYGRLKEALAGSGIEAAAGPQAVCEAAARDADWVMAAIVGAAGLAPTLAAVERGATIALANKECLVCAGDLFMAEIRRAGATFLPVDSEHNAIFQVFDFEKKERIERIILTASGGPFRDWTREAMAKATPEQAVAHPNWSMGAKISVDSASMFNKGLEFIEAYHIFGIAPERIEILVHPQSVIHSMVGYVDGSVLAQLGSPDMRTPIAYCLAWPDRMVAPVPHLDFPKLGHMDFRAPDPDRFPAIRIVRETLRRGGVAPTAMNAANEVAVAGFLGRQIGFLDIPAVVEATIDDVMAGPLGNQAVDHLDAVMAVDGEARRIAAGHALAHAAAA